MGILILTGMSGGGKSQAAKFLEDIGYFCIDNMPLQLFSKFGEMYKHSEIAQRKTAFVTDVRSGSDFSDLYNFIDEMKNCGENVKIVFIDCNDSVILKRYKENKRLHPLAQDGNNVAAIEAERIRLDGLKTISDIIIDTSNYSIWDLKKKIVKLFSFNSSNNGIKLNVISFGYKYGVPQTCDILFDVRFLKNPYYIDELKFLTGNDLPVKDYVLKSDCCEDFLNKLLEMLVFLMPLYSNEGKEILELGIGCTGGKHRSVTIANEIARSMKDRGYSVFIEHRDILK